jgi:hypothetical protein
MGKRKSGASRFFMFHVERIRLSCFYVPRGTLELGKSQSEKRFGKSGALE